MSGNASGREDRRPCPLCGPAHPLPGWPCPVCRGEGWVPAGEEADRFRKARRGILDLLVRISEAYEEPDRSRVRDSLLEALEDLYRMDGALEKAVQELLRRLDEGD